MCGRMSTHAHADAFRMPAHVGGVPSASWPSAVDTRVTEVSRTSSSHRACIHRLRKRFLTMTLAGPHCQKLQGLDDVVLAWFWCLVLLPSFARGTWVEAVL